MKKHSNKEKWRKIEQKYPLLNWRFNLKLIFVALAVCFLILAPLVFMQDDLIQQLNKKVQKYESQQIVSFERLSLQEFQDKFSLRGQSMAYIEAYAVQQEFTKLQVSAGFIKATKDGECIELNRGYLCDETTLLFNQARGLHVDIIKTEYVKR